MPVIWPVVAMLSLLYALRLFGAGGGDAVLPSVPRRPASFLTRFPCACSGKQISGQNCFQRLRSLHIKSWIIAALICSTSAAYAAEDDNKIHPTCVEENNTRRCWVDHWPPAGVRPPQLQPVAPAPQAAIPPTAPTMVPVSPPARWLPPPLSSGSDRMG
jgi:hypothetical protein